MLIKRDESWGKIIYDTKTHAFSYKLNQVTEYIPQAKKPLVLNIDLSFECNMLCEHCVAEDMAKRLGGKAESKLEIDENLMKAINDSPFMVLVITGGEPILPQNEGNLIKLIGGVDQKGIIIDTNGINFPSKSIINLILEKDVMVRVSWDLPHPKKEAELRKYPKNLFKSDMEYLYEKEETIKRYVNAGAMVSIQTVLHKFNYNNSNFNNFPYKLEQLKIKQWYIQRFIPSHKRADAALKEGEYERRINKLLPLAKKLSIKCFFKRDKRHNSVFLLVKNGDLYTQSDEKAGEKVYLGKLGQVDYFDYVSNTEHNARYVLSEH